MSLSRADVNQARLLKMRFMMLINVTRTIHGTVFQMYVAQAQGPLKEALFRSANFLEAVIDNEMRFVGTDIHPLLEAR